MLEEKKSILKMIEDGKITAEEGIKLLDALDEESTSAEFKAKKNRSKFLRVVVVDPEKDTDINIKIPLIIAKWGINIGKTFHPESKEVLDDIDFDELIKLVEEGAQGELVNVIGERGEKVKVFVE